MTTFPGSPKLMKGALITCDLTNPQRSVIIFQYNPETVTRRFEARAMGGDSQERVDLLRLIGPPRETITFTIEVDASDQLEVGIPTAMLTGLHPVISTLELMLYPTIQHVNENLVLAKAGEMEIIPPEAPLNLLFFGPQRIIPVKLTGFSITEEAHDPLLNPLRAKIELTLTVLTYVDLKQTSLGFKLSYADQVRKEIMAVAYITTQAISEITGFI